jgi:hypothetical protein
VVEDAVAGAEQDAHRLGKVLVAPRHDFEVLRHGDEVGRSGDERARPQAQQAAALLGKSAGTGCGPNTALSTFGAFLIDSGIASVQAMIQRMSGDLMASGRNTGGSFS